jgi:DNA polymerase elongation subunit (family B)
MNNISSMWYRALPNFYLYVKNNGELLKLSPPFLPYFFIESGKEEVVRFFARKISTPVNFVPTELTTIDRGKKLTKVEVNFPFQVSRLRDLMKNMVNTYESDIPYERRVRLDMKWNTSLAYKTSFFDIEVSVKEMEGGKIREGQIITISLYDGMGNNTLISSTDEEYLLATFIDTISSKYDLVVGYNSDHYDKPLIESKARKFGLLRSLPEEVRFSDIYWMIRSSLQQMLPTWTLDSVSKKLIGQSRIYTDRPFKDLTLSEIEKRCIRDSELLYLIEEKHGFVSTAVEKAHISNLFPDEVESITRCIDTLLLTEARKNNMGLPNRLYSISGRHSGAFVAQPAEALKVFRGVLVLDVASMYPNIILNFKLSPDKDKILYPAIVKNLLEERLKWKEIANKTEDPRADIRQKALKVFLNAIYGSLNATSRIFSFELGDEVARRGREILQTLISSSLEEMKIPVIYADTDSVFLNVGEKDLELFDHIKRFLEDSIRSKFGFELSIDIDTYFSKIFFPRRVAGAGASGVAAAKKKYYGIVTFEKGRDTQPYLKVVGAEYVRSDFPRIIRELQFGLVDKFLSDMEEKEQEENNGGGGSSSLHSSSSDRMDFIYETAEDFKKALWSGLLSYDELSFSKSVMKNEYKSKPHHVIAAEKLQKKTGVRLMVGDKVQFIYTRHGIEPLPITNPEDLAPLDRDYYFQLFSNVIERTFGVSVVGDKTLDSYTLSGLS